MDDSVARTPRSDADVVSGTMTVGVAKATPEMRRSLEELGNALLCPLCNAIFQSPMTSSCGHSFCRHCIDSYSSDNYNCPVNGCGLPLSMSSRGKSYRQLNPALSTAVTAYLAILQELSAAPDQWWDIDPDAYQTTTTQQLHPNDKSSEVIDLAAVHTSPASSRVSDQPGFEDDDSAMAALTPWQGF